MARFRLSSARMPCVSRDELYALGKARMLMGRYKLRYTNFSPSRDQQAVQGLFRDFFNSLPIIPGASSGTQTEVY